MHNCAERYTLMIIDILSEDAYLQNITTPRKESGDVFTTAYKTRQES
jgi:hypothetical protein